MCAFRTACIARRLSRWVAASGSSPGETIRTGGSCFFPAITTPPRGHRHDPGDEHYSPHAPYEDSTDHATRHETAEQYGQETPAQHEPLRQDRPGPRRAGTPSHHAHKWRAASPRPPTPHHYPAARTHAQPQTHDAGPTH